MNVKQRSLAFDDDTLAIVDDYARRLEEQRPGLRISRSAAARALIRSGVAADAERAAAQAQRSSG